ncbi:sensor histidine kinase [Desulforegula conservatrix]|uniref:hypothetical protein n=1 Tax=Desulforegula conservatrix TaxID=153026 RepID=UPI000417B898|nr:hypothetical protein [Desulforegula conservatrix]
MENTNRQLRFFGNITAGATHEINNVLSVIKENAGLIEDLFMMAEKQGMIIPFEEKIKKSISSIKETVKKGAQVTSDLNAFAHIPDHDTKTVKVSEAVKMIARLNNRKASRLGIKIEVADKPESMEAVLSPVLFHKIIQIVIGILMDSAENGSVIRISSGINDSGSSRKLKINFAFEDPGTLLKDRLVSHPSYQDVAEVAEQMAAEVSASEEGIILCFDQIQ